MSSLEANQRLNKTKGSNNLLRKQGLVPCIVYGGKEENELIEIKIRAYCDCIFISKLIQKLL